MHLSSILKEYGVDIKKTKLVRHPLNKTDIRDVYERGMIEAYQSSQSKNCFDNCKYIASFVGTTGTEAKFIGLYESCWRQYRVKLQNFDDYKKHEALIRECVETAMEYFNISES